MKKTDSKDTGLISGPARGSVIAGDTAVAPSTDTLEGLFAVGEGDSVFLIRSESGDEKRLKVKENTKITRNGKPAAYKDLRSRDRIRVHYDSDFFATEIDATGPFTLSKEALDTHLDFLKEKDPSIVDTHQAFLREKDPSIVGKTCQMLSALKIVILKEISGSEAFNLVIGIIEGIKEEQEREGIKQERKKLAKKISEEEWSDFRLNSLDKYLPKILNDPKWIYSMEDYLVDKFNNAWTVESRRKKKQVPLYIEITDANGNVTQIENPEIKDRFDQARIENTSDINKIFERAELIERQLKIYVYKVLTPYTENLVAEILGVSRETVKLDYSKAKQKIQPVADEILSQDR